MKLVTLEQAKSQLNMDHDEDDLLIELFIEGASDAVLNYLKSGADYFLDSNREVEVDVNGEAIGIPPIVKTCVMYMVGVLYRNRDENPDEIFEHGYLPKPVIAMLYPLRDPALA